MILEVLELRLMCKKTLKRILLPTYLPKTHTQSTETACRVLQRVHLDGNGLKVQ